MILTLTPEHRHHLMVGLTVLPMVSMDPPASHPIPSMLAQMHSYSQSLSLTML